MKASTIYKLKRLIYLTPLSKSRLLHYLRYKYRYSWILAVIKKFGRDDDYKVLLSQMRRAYIKFRWNADEFFLFQYEKLTDAQRSEFCPEFDHNTFCLKVNNWDIAQDFRDKWKTYLRFRPFFKRECILITSSADLKSEPFVNFITNNPVFLMKSLDQCCGRGINKISNKDLTPLYRFLSDGGTKCILEPFIKQSSELSVLHPESVNTLRIPTINYGDHIEIFHPFLRIGRGDSFVDNAGAGGIGGNINVQTGTIYCAGDECGNSYIYHPDTNVRLIDFKIPKWEEAVSTAIALAKQVPDVRYIGWDLALTDDGWVLIEGNEDGQFVFQYFSHSGVKEEVTNISKKLK